MNLVGEQRAEKACRLAFFPCKVLTQFVKSAARADIAFSQRCQTEVALFAGEYPAA